MQYTHFERANIDVSKICFGAQRFERPQEHQEYVELILYAFEKGINFFDTAELYCEDQSEIILGKAVKEMKKSGKPFYISSKCLDADHDTFRANLERTLKRLNMEYLDFYTPLWGVKSFLDWTEAKRFGALDEILKAQEEGLINHVSITTHMENDDLEKVVEDYPFAVNIIGYNVINSRSRSGGIEASHKSGVTNIAMNPLGTGIVVKYPEIFDAMRIREGQSLVSAAYDFVLSSEYVDCIVGGFSSKEHVDDAVSALANHVPYTEEEKVKVQKALQERIMTIPLEERYKIAMDMCTKMYILRDEVAQFMNVYPMRIWR